MHCHFGQVEEALAALEEAKDLADETKERWWDAEIHRFKGEMLLALSVDNKSDSEICFHEALSVSRSQQSKSLELRAAMSLSRLWQSQDKRKEAFNLLAPVYEWFTEGHDTADLKDAKALIDELS